MGNKIINKGTVIWLTFGLLIGICFAIPFSGRLFNVSGVTIIVGELWTLEDGDTLYPNNESWNVSIGKNDTTTYKLYVNGTSYFNASMDILGNIVPVTNDTYTLGSNLVHWQTIYAQNYIGDGANLKNITIPSETFLPYNVSTLIGTHTGGDVDSMDVPEDGLSYNVTENSGPSPVLRIRVNFTNITTFDSVIGRIYYEGGSGHTVQLEIWRFDTLEWENYIEFTDMTDFVNFYVPVFDPVDHVDIASSDVWLRFDHAQNGKSTHTLKIDYLALIDGFTALTVSDHDALGGRDDIENHPWAMPISAFRNFTNIVNNTMGVRIGASAAETDYNITFDGESNDYNITFDESEDTIIFENEVDILGNLNMSSDIEPTTNISYNLGSNLLHWNNVYAEFFFGDGSGLINIVGDGFAGSLGHPHDQDLNTTDAVTFATVDTGQGANELYDMDQNVLTTSPVTFLSIVGIGADLTNLPNIFDQWLNTTDAATFTTVDTGEGANELYDMDQNVLTTSAVTFTSIIGIGADLTNLPNIFNQWLNETDNATFDWLDTLNDANISGVTRTDNLDSINDYNITVDTNLTFNDDKIINATGLLTIGDPGDITIGDSTERDMYPQTDGKINLGTSSNMFNDGYFSGTLNASVVLLPTINTGATLTGYEIAGSIVLNTTTNLMGTYNGAYWYWR